MLAYNNIKPHHKQKSILSNAIYYSAVYVIILGALMALIWISHTTIFDAIFPNIFHMKFNTAMLFICAGGGLITAKKGDMKYAIIAALIILIFGKITLIEYIRGTSLGIDQLFVKDYRFPDIEYPGRMSPPTSLAFTLFSVGLLLYIYNKTRSNHRIIIALEFLSFTVFALGMLAMAGHLSSSELAYSWGSYTRMAIQTSTGFMALGIGLISLTWHGNNFRIAHVPLWVPALLCFSVLVFDINTPLGVATGIAYIPLIFCSLWFARPYTTFVFAAITTMLTVFGYFASPVGITETWQVITNRVLTIGALWFVAALVYMNRKTYDALQLSLEETVSAKKVTESALKETELANQVKNEFLANMSHELRTPMNGIIGMVEVLQVSNLGPEHDTHMEIMSFSSNRMVELIDEMLDFVKINANKLTLELNQVDLKNLIVEIVGKLEPIAQEHNVNINIHYGDDIPHSVLTDKIRLKQILNHLVNNAIKFTQDGSIDIYVTNKSPDKTHAVLRFEIKDSGIGIPKEKQQEIFEKFTQVDNSSTRKYGGVGLGLSICKKLVQLMGGNIGVISNPGEGALFWFEVDFLVQVDK